jgi:hypothetical protein
MNSCHARTARASAARYCDHILKPGNDRSTVFQKNRDDDAFREMMVEATLRVPMRDIA